MTADRLTELAGSVEAKARGLLDRLAATAPGQRARSHVRRSRDDVRAYLATHLELLGSGLPADEHARRAATAHAELQAQLSLRAGAAGRAAEEALLGALGDVLATAGVPRAVLDVLGLQGPLT